MAQYIQIKVLRIFVFLFQLNSTFSINQVKSMTRKGEKQHHQFNQKSKEKKIIKPQKNIRNQCPTNHRQLQQINNEPILNNQQKSIQDQNNSCYQKMPTNQLLKNVEGDKDKNKQISINHNHNQKSERKYCPQLEAEEEENEDSDYESSNSNCQSDDSGNELENKQQDYEQQYHQDQCQQKWKQQQKYNGKDGLEEQNQEEDQSESSKAIIPAIKNIVYRKVRGTRIQGLIEGKIKMDDGILSNQVNNYLGVKNKHKDIKADKQAKKKQQCGFSQDSLYNYNEDDSSDIEDYIQSSSGRDEFDSDFDLTESYPGKRGRKKGSRGRRRGRGRGREHKAQINQENPDLPREHKKRGRPKKIRPLEDLQHKQVDNQNNQDNPQKRRRGRPKKNLVRNTDSIVVQNQDPSFIHQAPTLHHPYYINYQFPFIVLNTDQNIIPLTQHPNTTIPLIQHSNIDTKNNQSQI